MAALGVLVVVVGVTTWLSLRPAKGEPDETLQASGEVEERSRPEGPAAAPAQEEATENDGGQSGSTAPGRVHEKGAARGRGAETARAPSRSPAATPRSHALQSGVIERSIDVSGLPKWPAPAAIVYAGKELRGRSQTFPVGAVPHLRGTRLGDNAASSLDVVGGAHLTLYLKPDYVGRNETFATKVQSLKNSTIRNNRASSLKVEPPDVGRILWRSGPVYSLGLTFEIERGQVGVVVLYGQAKTATYVSPALIPDQGPGLEALLSGQAAVLRALGSPVTRGVRLQNGMLAVQLFKHGELVYAPGSKRGWYHVDGV